MYRSLWQAIIDKVVDFVQGALRSQSEIDEFNEDQLDLFGQVHYDEGDVPANARLRPNYFLTVEDAIAWVDRAGIPREYVHFYVEEYGYLDNPTYHVYVIDGS